MRYIQTFLCILCFLLYAQASSNEIYLNRYSKKGCKGDITQQEKLLTLEECTKGSRYILHDTDVFKCSFNDIFCVGAKTGDCSKLVTINKCIDDENDQTSSKYIVGEDPSPFVVGFFIIGVISAVLYVSKNKKATLPEPIMPQNPTTLSSPSFSPSSSSPSSSASSSSDEEIISSPKITGNSTKDVDNQLNTILAKLKVTGPIDKIGDCKYKIGSKKVTMQVLGGYLVVRVGGGFMKFEEWIQRFGRKEGLTISDELVKGVGVSTLNSRGGHTIKPIPQKS